MTDNSAPEAADVEVSLFGPGLGESVVVHIGGGKWMVVDSCVAAGECVPLRYLQSIGVDVRSNVVVVVATHAHDDHVRGIAEIYRNAKVARLAVPMASTKEEFAYLVALDELHVDLRLRVFREYSGLFAELKSRQKVGQRLWYGLSNRSLVLRSAADGIETVVVALSPSDEDVLASRADLAAMFPSAGELPRRAMTRDPNHFAMALLVRCGTRTVVLASDILTGQDGVTGWSAVVCDHDHVLPATQLYKVAHHGSETGHHDQAWDLITSEGVVSILTPFLSGRVRLPKDEDVTRLKERCGDVFISSGVPTLTRAQQRMAASITGSATGVHLAQGQTGQIRARASAVDHSPWRVEALGHARRL